MLMEDKVNTEECHLNPNIRYNKAQHINQDKAANWPKSVIISTARAK